MALYQFQVLTTPFKFMKCTIPPITSYNQLYLINGQFNHGAGVNFWARGGRLLEDPLRVPILRWLKCVGTRPRIWRYLLDPRPFLTLLERCIVQKPKEGKGPTSDSVRLKAQISTVRCVSICLRTSDCQWQSLQRRGATHQPKDLEWYTGSPLEKAN